MARGTAAGSRRIVFVGNARCYHTIDWYRTVRRLEPRRPVVLVTDLIESEGHRRLVAAGDEVINLFNIDHLLLKEQSRGGNLWRNAVKLLVVPLQVLRLRAIYRRWRDAAYHAHTMYYMLVCWLAGVPFIGTPQGSEILVRPGRSTIYRMLAVRSLRAATAVTVDSVLMRDEVRRLSGVEADIVQNGVEIDALSAYRNAYRKRDVVLSLRGMTSLYRIFNIVEERNRTEAGIDLTVIYPFWDDEYRRRVRARLRPGDRDLGRLDKDDMGYLLGRTMLAVSIPTSDSSPRSIYEAIFAGACVAASEGRWLEILPNCMRGRIKVVDPATPGWLESAVTWARDESARRYLPSDEACRMFDQRRSLREVIRCHYARESEFRT